MLGSVVLRPPRLRAGAGSGSGGLMVGLELWVFLCFLDGSGVFPAVGAWRAVEALDDEVL